MITLQTSGVFLWDCEIFKHTFFYRTPLEAASVSCYRDSHERFFFSYLGYYRTRTATIIGTKWRFHFQTNSRKTNFKHTEQNKWQWVCYSRKRKFQWQLLWCDRQQFLFQERRSYKPSRFSKSVEFFVYFSIV